jgi:deazaflavin-dependent oxidoreductase (nitroreductase family)
MLAGMSASDEDRARRLGQHQSDPLAVNRMMIERYRATGGSPPEGQPGSAERMLLLTTIGARSGQPHTAPMMYLRDGDRLVVYASNAGAPKAPAWYHNLVAHHDVTVEVGRDRFEATATVTEGDERERLWKLFPFPEHEQQAGRPIPVVALTRRV